MKFKLLRGLHSHGGKTYQPGNVVESDTDFVARFGRLKFERLLDDTAPITQQAADQAAEAGFETVNELRDLSKMTVSQLRTYAAENEVDLGDARTKDQILAVLTAG